MFNLLLKNANGYYEFGNVLAPLNIWSDSLNEPRLLNLELFEQDRQDGLLGQYRIIILPSDQKISFGVAININNHFNLEQNQKGTKV